MTLKKFVRPAGMVAICAAIILAGTSLRSIQLHAEQGHSEEGDFDQNKVQQGFAISPVTLNMRGKDRELVGLGSYIVNAQADCNGCHSLGPETEFAANHNPYFGEHPTKVNPATFLGGGRDFGPFPGPGPFPHIVSRNLTPDSTGRPEGGHTFEEFFKIMKTGKDFDHLHPTCTGAPDGTCLPKPFDGDLLQIMPWPIHQNMTERDIRAIYEYLSAIPCIDTVIEGQPQLRNQCK